MPETVNNQTVAWQIGYEAGMKTYIYSLPSQREQYMKTCQSANPFKGQGILATRFEQGFLRGFHAE